MPRQPRTYTPETKAQVMAAIAMGTPVATVARAHGIPRATARLWAASGATLIAQARPETRISLGELIWEYMRTGFEALIARHKALADSHGQGAAATAEDYRAVLHGLVLVGRGIDEGREQGSDAEPDSGEDDSP